MIKVQTLVLLLALVAIGQCSSVYAQEAGQPPSTQKQKMTNQQLADFGENAAIFYMCKKDPTLMTCMGVDPRQDMNQCVAVLRAEMPTCKASLLKALGDQPSEELTNQAFMQFASCVGMGAMTSKGLLHSQVEACAKGSAAGAP